MNFLLTVFGVFIAILGVGVTIQQQFFLPEVRHLVSDV